MYRKYIGGKLVYEGKEHPLFRKPIDQMSSEELSKEFRRRAAECGGCNRSKDISQK